MSDKTIEELEREALYLVPQFQDAAIAALADRCRELEKERDEARAALRHVFYRNHDYLLDGCSGCESTKKALR